MNRQGVKLLSAMLARGSVLQRRTLQIYLLKRPCVKCVINPSHLICSKFSTSKDKSEQSSTSNPVKPAAADQQQQEQKQQQQNQASTKLKGMYNKGPISFVSLGLMLLVGAGMLAYYNFEKEKKTKSVSRNNVKTIGKPALGGPWVLVDQHGVPRTDASYRGRFALLYFGFTYCPDICPSELVKVGNIINALESKKMAVVKPVFISVDPRRDSIGQLRHYAQDFHSEIDYLTGTVEQLAAAARAYRVYFSKANENEEDEEDYLVDHSIVLYLISPDGEFLDFFTQRMEVAEIVDRIANHVKEHPIKQSN